MVFLERGEILSPDQRVITQEDDFKGVDQLESYHYEILTISYDISKGEANLIRISTSLMETLVTFHPTIVLFP